MVTEVELRNHILSLQNSGKTLRDIEKIVGVSNGTVCRISKGIFPKSDDLRKKLNLPLLELVEACPKCNTVHTKKCRLSFSERLKGHPNRKQILELYYGMILKINAVDCKRKSKNKNDG